MSKIREALNKVVNGVHLTEDEAVELMEEIMNGRSSDAQIAALITALRIKGETVEEITGFAKVMRQMATPIMTNHNCLLDTCGTGGDGSETFNISTTVAFIAAAAGIPVAKHGNRSVSSRSGSADVLETLGVNLKLTPEQVGECIDLTGIGFLFAPALHGAMKYAIGPRKEIGIRTVFNILGPLTNPAGAQCQLLGVYSPELTQLLAEVLAKLGAKSAMVIHGSGGLDEASTLGKTKVSEVKDGKVNTYEIDPYELGIPYVTLDEIKGGTPEENAEIVRNLLNGEKGAKRDIVLLNSAIALKVFGSVKDLREGIIASEHLIDSGAAFRKLNQFVDFTRKFSNASAQVS